MERNQKCLFAITDDKSAVILGIPKAGWDFMSSGFTHTFDLENFGIPVKIILFGGKDHADLKRHLSMGAATVDLSNQTIDFGFGPTAEDTNQARAGAYPEWEAGRNAFKGGESLTDCPFPELVPQNYLWRGGWLWEASQKGESAP
jgi:hypothetical protein